MDNQTQVYTQGTDKKQRGTGSTNAFIVRPSTLISLSGNRAHSSAKVGLNHDCKYHMTSFRKTTKYLEQV